MRDAFQAQYEAAAEHHDAEECARIEKWIERIDCRIAKFAAAHAAFMDLGERLHVDAPVVKVIRRPARRLAPRRRGAGRPAGHRRVRRCGASSSTSSADPADPDPALAHRRGRCASGGRRRWAA